MLFCFLDRSVESTTAMTSAKMAGTRFLNIREVRSRGASVLLFTSKDFAVPSDCADDVVYLPDVPELFCPLSAVVTAQLLAYYTAVKLGRDVDKPRNLAKSVTVE